MSANGARSKLPAPFLDGSHSVAALLLAMERPAAARLLKHFEDDEIRVIVRSAATLGAVSRDQLADLVDRLESELDEAPNVVGSQKEALALIQSALPEDQLESVLAAMDDSPVRVDIWNRLPGLDTEQVTETVLQQNLQVAAFILSRVDTELASTILGSADRDVRRELLDRMLDTGKVKDRPTRLLEQFLSEIFVSDGSEADSSSVHTHVAGILNRLDRDEVDEIVQSMSVLRPREAESIRKQIFNFSDICVLTPQARGKLFEGVPPEKLVLALTGADETLVDAALGSLTARARRMIEMELQSSRGASRKDVEAAQRWIADLAIGMARDGKIELVAEEEDE